MEPIFWFFTVVGIIGVLFVIWKLLCALFRIVYPYVIARPKDLHKLAGAKWALVTGASDGIGKEYAMELAKRGFNIVLVARSMEKLRNVQTEIQAKHASAQVKIVVFDFTNASAEAYQKHIFAEIEHLSIGILVNNVGVMSKSSRFQDKAGGIPGTANEVIVNTLPHTLLTAFVLKQMTARKSGIIINISSILSYVHYYHNAVYSSVKKYLCWFIETLRKEYKGTGVIIQTICPGLVHTKMPAEIGLQLRPGFFSPEPAKFVQSALRTVGVMDETAGCIGHQIQTEGFKVTPKFLLDIVLKKRAHKMEMAIAQSQVHFKAPQSPI